MRKLFILLGSFMLGLNSSIVVTGCNNNTDNNSDINTPKHEMTKANLDNFFATNNSFSYKGPSFFKDGVQTDNIYPISQVVRTILENIISNSIKEKFKDYFILKLNYIFNILHDGPEDYKNLYEIKTINFNEEKQYQFQLAVYINNPFEFNMVYCSNWLTISFTETRQYNPQEWLEAYKNFLISGSNSIFSNIITDTANSQIIYVEIEDRNWRKKPELIKKYQTDNNSDLFYNIKYDINNSIGVWTISGWQFYKENVFKVSFLNSYKYVAIDYYPGSFKTEIRSIIVNVNITISYDPAYSPYTSSQTFNLNINCC